MNKIKFVIAGIFFGFLIVKSEALTWFRIQEMFRFQSFHMFGIFAMAILVGGVTVFGIKRYHLKTVSGETILLKKKPLHVKAQIFGGLLFGFGWVLTGLCIAPIYALLGTGHVAGFLVLLGALVGVFTYGFLKNKLPH
jgi:uncharacterized membrane protein YedE/YeeE